jgi:hypothetical protein
MGDGRQEWRREFGVDEITEASISRVAASGEAYYHDSLSKDGKPVIVVTSAKHFPNVSFAVSNLVLGFCMTFYLQPESLKVCLWLG